MHTPLFILEAHPVQVYGTALALALFLLCTTVINTMTRRRQKASTDALRDEVAVLCGLVRISLAEQRENAYVLLEEQASNAQFKSDLLEAVIEHRDLAQEEYEGWRMLVEEVLQQNRNQVVFKGFEVADAVEQLSAER